MKPDDEHGNSANITYDELRQAAQANGMSVEETIDTMARTAQQAGGSGQSGQYRSPGSQSGTDLGQGGSQQFGS
ncbi:MAG TPA: hypothetical protein VF763_06875 [Candidatus Limnocylindrales bacterium]